MSMPRHPGLWTKHALCEDPGSVLGRTVDPTRSGLHGHRLFPADYKLVVFSPPAPGSVHTFSKTVWSVYPQYMHTCNL